MADPNRRLAIAVLAATILNLIGPDGSWRSVLWRSRQPKPARVVNLPPLYMEGSMRGELSLNPTIAVPKGPLIVEASLGRARLDVSN